MCSEAGPIVATIFTLDLFTAAAASAERGEER
jgi:hypothetical protein